MKIAFLSVSIIVLACLHGSAALRSSKPSTSRSIRGVARHASFLEDIVSIKGGVFQKLKPLAPVAGYFAVMLAPIYGIGLPLFLGKMTDFSTLKNRCFTSLCNEYIVAPDEFTTARVNELPPSFSVSAEELKQQIDSVVMKQPRISKVAEEADKLEYVQRSLIFRFPDVITFQVIPEGSKESTLAVHSYSIYGAGDLGVNGNRVKSWLEQLRIDVPPVR
jgi:uncharacterized protein (DUF1499 family)